MGFSSDGAKRGSVSGRPNSAFSAFAVIEFEGQSSWQFVLGSIVIENAGVRVERHPKEAATLGGGAEYRDSVGV